MSGIAGIFYLDGRPVREGQVEAMLATMAHRGPDGAAVWRRGSIGLGHCMLQTTPESLHEQLPLESIRGGIVLTADARIDNRSDVLTHVGLQSRSGADSELMLAAYERWGEGMLDHLIGDFAFAVWDSAQRRLLCAVDHLGTNQFYYVHRPGSLFCFASEMKALFTLEEVAPEIDEVRLGETLTWMRRAPGSTIFKGISKVPPAHVLTVTADGVRLNRYWTMEPSDEAEGLSKEACTERFLELFREAVASRMRSAFPIGIELSGGLDSSFVAGMARTLTRQSGSPVLKTLSLVYDQLPECDERPYIKDVLAEGGFEAIYVHADQIGPLSTARELYDTVDDGRMGVGSTYRRWHMYKAARRHGVRVVLTGIDGDTTVSHGREYLYELAAQERWEDFAREAKLYAGRLDDERQQYATQEHSIASPQYLLSKMAYPYLADWAYTGQWWRFARAAHAISRLYGIPVLRIYRQFWRKLVIPRRLAEAKRRAAYLDSIEGVHPIVRADFAARIGLAQRRAAYKRESMQRFTVREQQLNRFRIDSMAAELDYINHYAASHSIEARHPFMDIRLIQFCLGMSPTMSLHDGWSRAIMRWAMEGYVPESIRWRTAKTNLENVFSHGLFEIDGALVQELMERLTPMEPFVNRDYIERVVRRREEDDPLDFTLVASTLGKVIWLEKLNEREGTRILPEAA